MSETLDFTIHMRAEPQGSARAFVIPGTNRATITHDNKKIKPFRSELAKMAIVELAGRSQPLFGKHVPVHVSIAFHFQRPASAKKRFHPAVKPDLDKLQRAVLDALTGVAFHDDAQVVSISAKKYYAPHDHVRVAVWRVDE